MRSTFISAAFAALTCAFASPALASEWKPHIVTGASFGGAVLGQTLDTIDGVDAENFGQKSDIGWNASVHAGAGIGRDWAALVEVSYSEAEAAGRDDIGVGGDDVRILAGFLTAQYRFATIGRLRPYVELGAGLGNIDDGYDDTTAFGLKGAFGLDYAVGERTSIFGELQYAKFFGVDYEVTGSEIESSVSSTTLNFGVNQRF